MENEFDGVLNFVDDKVEEDGILPNILYDKRENKNKKSHGDSQKGGIKESIREVGEQVEKK